MILSIQYLRAVAALAVVLFHLSGKLPLDESQRLYAELGAAGVDVFFVISGVAMSISTHGRNLSPLTFYARRIVRIVPLYWIVTSLVALVVALAPSVAGSSRLDVDHVVASYLFLAWPHPGADWRLWPLLIPGWTLNYEMFFYVLVGVVLVLPRRRFAALVALIAGLVALGAVLDLGPLGRFYTSPLMLEFLAGFAIAHLYQTGVRVPPALCVVGIAAALALFATVGAVIDPVHGTRALRWGSAAALLVASAMFLDRARIVPESRVGHLLGDASYSLYLVQFLAVPAFVLAWRTLRLPLEGGSDCAAFIVVGAATVSLAGITLHRLIEKPMLDAMKDLLSRSRDPADRAREVERVGR